MKEELHTLSGAYAVHALPYAEWVLFEEHLHTCPGCSAEVRNLRETAARLAEAVAEQPPARLRGRLLHAAHRSRRPEDLPEQGRDDSPTVWRPPQERRPLALPPDAPTLSLPQEPAFRMAPEIAATPEAGNVVPLRRRTRLTAALAAVSAAAAIALGVVAFDARRDLGEASTRNEELVAVLAAPDAETMRQPVTTGGMGTVVISRGRGRMVFTSSGLAGLPESKTYELWLMGPDGPRPGGLVERRADGVSAPMVLAPLNREDHVALTVEPAEGSDRPTTQAIMLAELPEA
ncbi:anti-sigma factor [Nonomuraea insulae]|uniref:Regulator of SigK n=1 Tax=Nonomuraea insulae TaxID=1616787 RepID=A0ABW1D378_9ACTN